MLSGREGYTANRLRPGWLPLRTAPATGHYRSDRARHHVTNINLHAVQKRLREDAPVMIPQSSHAAARDQLTTIGSSAPVPMRSTCSSRSPTPRLQAARIEACCAISRGRRRARCQVADLVYGLDTHEVTRESHAQAQPRSAETAGRADAEKARMCCAAEYWKRSPVGRRIAGQRRL